MTKNRPSMDLGRIAAFSALVAVLLLSTLVSKTEQEAVWLVIGSVLSVMITYYSVRSLLNRLSDKTPDSECALVARAKKPILFYAGTASVLVGVAALVFRHTCDAVAKTQLWIGISLLCLWWGGIYTFLGAFQLKLCGEEIRYWSLAGYRAINRREIKQACIRIGIDRFQPGIRLEILPYDVKKKPVIVALKAFRKDDMDQVFDWLGSKLKDSGRVPHTFT